MAFSGSPINTAPADAESLCPLLIETIMTNKNGNPDSYLGKQPWDKAHLRRCYFRDFIRTTKEIEALPGGQIFNELRTLQLSLSIFLDAVRDLVTSISKFKTQSSKPDFWHMINRPFVDKLEISIQRGILSSTMCAMALVDHSREFNKKYEIDGYEGEVKTYFSDNERHSFIHSLRRYVTHIRFTKANWLIKHSREGRSVFFLLDNETLSRFNEWSSLAKNYISKHEKGVNVEELFDKYSNDVEKFHSWLFVALFDKYGQQLSEYLKYLRLIKGFSSESNWNILIHQVVKSKGLNPYLYLSQYLQDDQIEDVFSRPYRSKEQVDRIIEIVDLYQICTETLRQEVYKTFKVTET